MGGDDTWSSYVKWLQLKLPFGQSKMARAGVIRIGFETECCYLKLNRILLTCFGLWPYQSSFSRRCSYLVFVMWTLTCLIPMILGLGEKSSTDIVITFETVVALLTIIGSLAQCTSLYLRCESVKRCYERMKTDWQSIDDHKEKSILQEFSRQGRVLTITYICCGTAAYIWFLSLTYLPLIIDKNVAADYSKIFPYYSQHWVIIQDYRNLQVFVHAALGTFYAGFIFIAATTFYVCNVKHVCAMYEIVCFRMRHLLEDEEVNLKTIKIKRKKSEKQVMCELLDIISKHRQIMASVRIIRGIFSRMFFEIEIFILGCLAMLIFDFYYHIGKSLLLSSRIVFITGIFIGYVFSINYAGQQIIAHSSRVSSSTYFMQWYSMNMNARKILLMILLKANKFDRIDAGLMTCSLENFTKILKISWSLACMLLSTQNK